MVGLSKYQLLSNTNPMESAPCLPPTRCGAGTVTSSHEGRTRGVPRHGLGGARLQAVAHPGRNHPVLALCNGGGGGNHPTVVRMWPQSWVGDHSGELEPQGPT